MPVTAASCPSQPPVAVGPIDEDHTPASDYRHVAALMELTGKRQDKGHSNARYASISRICRIIRDEFTDMRERVTTTTRAYLATNSYLRLSTLFNYPSDRKVREAGT